MIITYDVPKNYNNKAKFHRAQISPKFQVHTIVNQDTKKKNQT